MNLKNLNKAIKKWEDIKAKLEAESGTRPTGDIVIVNEVLGDLKEVKDEPTR
jgi:hypothetical protein